MDVGNGSSLAFNPSQAGLYRIDLNVTNSKQQHGWDAAMITTVDDNKSKYTMRAIKQADLARRIQNIIGRSSLRQFMDITDRNIVRNSPITRGDIIAAEDIYGGNLGSLKGKTTSKPTAHTNTEVYSVPPDIMNLYHDVTIAMDIMFVNLIPFIITISRGLKFGTIEPLPNRQILTITKFVQRVLQIYTTRGFTVTTMLADPEFAPLHNEFPGLQLNCCGADEHVPEAERYIRTIKDRARSAYNMLPFKRIPRIIVVHLVKNSNRSF